MCAAPAIRLAILWPAWTGYLDTSLAALFDRYPTTALLVQDRPHPQAPFDVTRLAAARRCEHAFYEDGFDALAARLDAFAPNLILTCSWAHPHYRRLCRRWRGRAVRAMHMDNQWRGTAKQWAGLLASPFLVRPTTDFAFVPGERQARFARRLGFTDRRIIRPSLSGAIELFAPVAVRPLHERKAFIFVARLAPEKGVHQLVEAYRAYRAAVVRPWPLIVCGTGPLADLLDDEPGIEAIGFVQPDDLPAQFARAACLVLPSLFEPYAVAVHEATAAGLGAVCSAEVAAVDDFVEPPTNGAIVPTGDVAALSRALADVTARSDAELETMRRHSVASSARITPQLWADALIGAFERGAR